MKYITDVVQSVLVLRVSVAFVSNGPPPTTSLWPQSQLTTKRTTTLFANKRRHPADPSGHGSSWPYYETSSNSSILCNNVVVTRRASLASAIGQAATLIPQNRATASTTNDYYTPQTITHPMTNGDTHHRTIPSLTIPLQYQPNLAAYTISYKVGTSTFGAIIDTGSPFLLVPQSSETSCRPEYRWGCFHPEETHPVEGLGPTMERFDGNEGLVEWREGKFSFDITTKNEKEIINANQDAASLIGVDQASAGTLEETSLSSDAALQSLLFPDSLMTFGVIPESLMDGPGGIFLGLVKNTDDWIRPSFLGQSDVSAFSVDLRKREGHTNSLTLYAGTALTEDRSVPSFAKINGAKTGLEGMLDTQNAIPLVKDLNKKYGDPTIHYVGVASSITANGYNLATSSRRNDKLYCIFDTGCSGMSVSPSLFDERYASARANKEKSLWGTVDVELKTVAGDTVTLSAKRPIVTPLGSERPWGKKLDGHLIVLGLSFLEGVKMTVDVDGGKIWLED